MSQIRLNSRFSVIGQLPYFQEAEIKAEPMLFSASWLFAIKKGGPLTRMFLRLVDDHIKEPVVIDSRVHMLMPGWFPCIPGWHLDDVPRTRPDGQPDHLNLAYKSEHICCVMGSASLTQFVDSEVVLEDVPVHGGVVYGKWNREINNLIGDGEVEPETIKEGNIIQFDWQTLHRGMPATKNGWRWFIRMSWNTDREIKDEIRQQTQVYLPAPEAGW